MFGLEYIIVMGVLLLISVLSSKVSTRLGIPSLVLFLILGIFANSQKFINWTPQPQFIELTGGLALAFILFSGGLDTAWKDVRKVFWSGIVLSTVGVLLTCFFVALMLNVFMGVPIIKALLFGAVVSSTDAAAVFNILKTQKVRLKGRIRPLLEFESGSNDPIAIFLTLALISVFDYTTTTSIWGWILYFFLQMGLGLVLGWAFGKLMVFLNNGLKLEFAGLYTVLSIALVLMTYSLTALCQGSGFLACYIAGLTLGAHRLVGRRALFQIHEGITWLVQICMFLVLGFLVDLTTLIHIIPEGILISLGLIFIARPIGVWVSTLPFSFNWREKGFISWVGLRGATAIILATYTVQVKGIDFSMFFNFVFFVVVVSVLLQGTSLPWFARLFKVNLPEQYLKKHPLDFILSNKKCSQLIEVFIQEGACIAGKQVVDIKLPEDTSIVMVNRKGQFLLVTGGSIIEEGDTVYAISSLAQKEALSELLKEIVKEKTMIQEVVV
jgi:potassium/hydrogen antiporter